MTDEKEQEYIRRHRALQEEMLLAHEVVEAVRKYIISAGTDECYLALVEKLDAYDAAKDRAP